MKSSSESYGTVALWIHWVTALAILMLVMSGLIAEDMEDQATKVNILRLHAPLGITILALTLFRIGWWLIADKRPAHLPGQPKWQSRAAGAVHGLLYVVVVVLGISGISMMVQSGAGEILFGGAARALPDFGDFLPRVPHGIAAKLLIALLVAHVGAALWHHYIKRDATLRRMWFPRKGG